MRSEQDRERITSETTGANRKKTQDQRENMDQKNRRESVEKNGQSENMDPQSQRESVSRNVLRKNMNPQGHRGASEGAGKHGQPGDNLRVIRETLARIRPADAKVKDAARKRQEDLAKPPGSLGGLEEIAVRMAGITGQVIPGAAETGGAPAFARYPGRGCVIVFCADNGVVTQGVASAPQSVTMAQTVNFTRRLTGVGALAQGFGSELLIVDMGVKDPIPAALYDAVPLRDTHKIVDRRIRPGTWDISQGPAMTEAEAAEAMAVGIEMAEAAADAGFGILGIGEMGIGNTTTSAAVLSVITGAQAEETCGRGGGLNDEGLEKKKAIVDAIFREAQGQDSQDRDSGTQKLRTGDPATHTPAPQNAVPQDNLGRILKILARCGGFDIAAMTGAYLGAAARRIPVVIDGYISVVAALAAAEIAPAAADCMFASHVSAEPGYRIATKKLEEKSPGMKPFLALDMRLGEGSGCPISFEIIRGACDVMKNMATFAEAEIDDDYLEEVRAGGCF